MRIPPAITISRTLGSGGTRIGVQANETLAVLAHQLGAVGRVQAGIGLHLAQATSGFLRQIAAGTFSALADYIQPKRKGD